VLPVEPDVPVPVLEPVPEPLLVDPRLPDVMSVAESFVRPVGGSVSEPDDPDVAPVEPEVLPVTDPPVPLPDPLLPIDAEPPVSDRV
jgi:hypothetical protein